MIKTVGRDTARKIEVLAALYKSFTPHNAQTHHPYFVIPAFDKQAQSIGDINIDYLPTMDEIQLVYQLAVNPEVIGDEHVRLIYAVANNTKIKAVKTLEERTQRELVFGKIVDLSLMAAAQEHIRLYPEDETIFSTTYSVKAIGKMDNNTMVPDGFVKAEEEREKYLDSETDPIDSAVTADDVEDINYSLALFERSARRL